MNSEDEFPNVFDFNMSTDLKVRFIGRLYLLRVP